MTRKRRLAQPAGRHRRLLPDRPAGLGAGRGDPAGDRIRLAPARRRAGRGPVRSAARPGKPGSYLNVPVDLTPFFTSGLLTPCQPDDPHEQARFVHYAAQFRSDGEAMCLALAESRGWPVATDDRKAIRVAQQAGLTVVSCPELVKAWADATRPDPATLVQVLTDIQTLAQFRPNSTMPESAWWLSVFILEPGSIASRTFRHAPFIESVASLAFTVCEEGIVCLYSLHVADRVDQIPNEVCGCKVAKPVRPPEGSLKVVRHVTRLIFPDGPESREKVASAGDTVDCDTCFTVDFADCIKNVLTLVQIALVGEDASP